MFRVLVAKYLLVQLMSVALWILSSAITYIDDMHDGNGDDQ